VIDHGFSDKLAWSRGVARGCDADTIRSMIPGCVKVEAAPAHLDRQGVDFTATLRRGAKLNIDIKAREPGVSRRWRTPQFFGGPKEPELTLEKWSAMPIDDRPGVAGWTLDESRITDYVLYLFAPTDSREAFLIPFQILRMVFIRNMEAWMRKHYVGHCESNGGPWRVIGGRRGWRTESVFVPAFVVLRAIGQEMRKQSYVHGELGA
jgi:hypothetical protein